MGSSKKTGVKTGVGYKRYIQNYMSDCPWPMLNIKLFWTCGYADPSFVAKPMSQPWTTLWWPRTWLLVPLFPSGSTF
jgi:hypothetical protein